MARKTKYEMKCERMVELGHTPEQMTLRQINDALLDANDPLADPIQGKPLYEEPRKDEKVKSKPARKPRKKKTDAQRAKAKATVERLVSQSRKETVDEFVKLIEKGGLN